MTRKEILNTIILIIIAYKAYIQRWTLDELLTRIRDISSSEKVLKIKLK